MDQSVKIAVAASVLLGGILLALMFRRESSRAGPPVPETGDRLVLRKHLQPRGGQAARQTREGQSKSPHAASAGPQPGIRTATVLKPVDPGEPPALARDYPGRGVPGTSRWGTSISVNLPEATGPNESVRTHKIVDGDSLHALAERYLGSADRYLEIYEANRDVLASPQLLPIGTELKILPPRQTPLPSKVPGSRRPLVPIPRQGPGEG